MRANLYDDEEDSRSRSSNHISPGRRKRNERRKSSEIIRPYLTRSKTQWETLIGSKLPRDSFHTDYVLVYRRPTGLEDPEAGPNEASEMRERFAKEMQNEGVQIQPEKYGKYIYLKIHVPFWRLCKEAERCRLELPVKGFESYQDEGLCDCWMNFVDDHLRTDNEVDFVSTPLVADKLHLFENGDDADKFFRPAVRSFLAHLILIQLNMSKKDDLVTRMKEKAADHHLGLLYMLHKDYYCDSFIVHDPTRDDRNILHHLLKMRATYGSRVDIDVPDEGSDIYEDTRSDLNDTWSKFYKYQPLWKIRNYFGEKIAFYFAWCGTLMTTLWIPMLFGIAVFCYGIYRSVMKKNAEGAAKWSNSTDKATSIVDDTIEIIKESFDNDVTPYYALFISIWGTVFLEVWKRTNATLAYEWDVDTFENAETDRPQFVGTVEIPDPIIIGETSMHSPFYRQCIKFGVSVSVLLFMICLVFIATAAIILYRIVITIDYCLSMSPPVCFLASTIGSSLLNAIVILVLGKLYDYVAVKLTDWENHRTDTEYNDSLILKLFAFQFANSYTSLFYIAFFRGRAFQGGIFGLGPEYRDTCGDKEDSSCMTMLSFQVLILMLTKPIPKFLMDVIMPALVYLWRKKLKSVFTKICFCCCRANKVQGEETNVKHKVPSFLEREHQKQELGNFTLSEFTEKIIIYGFLMLFAASFPLAPLLAFFILLVDIRVDAKRMLWLYRRPLAQIAQDIGMWYDILQFINVTAVVSNACLIAFTSHWGNNYDITGQLLIIIVFEHIAFAVKFIIAACIPDVPAWVQLAIKRENYQIRLIFDRDLEGIGDQCNHHSHNRASHARDERNEVDEAYREKKRTYEKENKSSSDVSARPRRQRVEDVLALEAERDWRSIRQGGLSTGSSEDRPSSRDSGRDDIPLTAGRVRSRSVGKYGRHNKGFKSDESELI